MEAGIITIRDLTGPARRFPLPSEFLATFVVFGGLALGSESQTWKGAANATAWGIVVATLLSSKVDFLKPVGDFFAGQVGPGTAATTAAQSVSGVGAARPAPNLSGQARKDF